MTRCLTYPGKSLAWLRFGCLACLGLVRSQAWCLTWWRPTRKELSGYATYASMPSLNTPATSFLLWGDAEAPFILSSTGTIWQSATGGNTGSETISFPGNEWDSWFTIGSEPGEQDNVPISTVGLTTAFNAFNSGQGFEISNVSGGAWFITYPCNAGPCSDETPGFAGVDRRVLLGQLTANGIWKCSSMRSYSRKGTKRRPPTCRASRRPQMSIFKAVSPGACNFSPSEPGQEANVRLHVLPRFLSGFMGASELHAEGPLEGMATVRIYAQQSDVSRRWRLAPPVRA